MAGDCPPASRSTRSIVLLTGRSDMPSIERSQEQTLSLLYRLLHPPRRNAMRCHRLISLSLICLFVALISVVMLAQSNPAPDVDRHNGLAPTAPQLPRALLFDQDRTSVEPGK